MLPVLLRAIAHGPDPTHALNRFSDIVERVSSGVNLYRLLVARPPLADMLSLILAHAPVLADQLARRPVLLDGLIDASSFAAPPERAAFAERLMAGRARRDYDEELDRVRRLVNERRFALGVQLIVEHRDPLDHPRAIPMSPRGRSSPGRGATREFERSSRHDRRAASCWSSGLAGSAAGR